jgi:SAM-dependent methyltransferase
MAKKTRNKREWFANWFDSPYYHILYQNHNEQEAQNFLDNLLAHLNPQIGVSRILDLACGKGRHSRYMAAKNFDVTGLDLSENSIRFAQTFESERLSFFQHDMRKAFRINYFDFIFNIFTSFGYFEKEVENLETLKSVTLGLKPDGVFILDYFNAAWVRATIQPNYVQTAGGIDFHIQKRIENGHIFKKIAFHTEGGDSLQFEEKVRLFSLSEFESLFEAAGLHIVAKFGDYQLNPFDETRSKRLILKAVVRRDYKI